MGDKRRAMDRAEGSFEEKCSQLKVEIEKCDYSSCRSSDFLSLEKEFNPSLKNYDVLHKKNIDELYQLQKSYDQKQNILNDPNRYSGPQVSTARKETKKIVLRENKISESEIELTQTSSRYLMEEILNNHVFGKCCASSNCKANVFDAYKLPMNYEKPSPASGTR